MCAAWSALVQADGTTFHNRGDCNRYLSAGGTPVSSVGTTTVVAIDPADPVVLSPVTLTAMVSPSSATGTVTFTATLDDSTVPLPDCDAAVVVSGIATCTFTPGLHGDLSVTAAYSGATFFGASTGTDSVEVAGISTTLVATSPESVQALSTVRLGATVTPAPSDGTVTFAATLDATAYDLPAACTDVALADGSAACEVTPTRSGAFAVTATYSGSSVHLGSSDTTATTIDKIPVTVSVVDNATPEHDVVFGDTIVFTATVAGGAGTPQGTIHWDTDWIGYHSSTLTDPVTGVHVSDVCADTPLVDGVATCEVTPSDYWQDESWYPFRDPVTATATFVPSDPDAYTGGTGEGATTDIIWHDFVPGVRSPWVTFSETSPGYYKLGVDVTNNTGGDITVLWCPVGDTSVCPPGGLSKLVAVPWGVFNVFIGGVCPVGVDYLNSFQCTARMATIVLNNQTQRSPA
jgi:hypothetical protein